MDQNPLGFLLTATAAELLAILVGGVFSLWPKALLQYAERIGLKKRTGPRLTQIGVWILRMGGVAEITFVTIWYVVVVVVVVRRIW